MQVSDLVMRVATRFDVDRVLIFYRRAAAEDANVLPRPAPEYESAIRSNLLYIVEDENEEIVAGAGAFQLGDPDTDISDIRPPVEFGSSYVLPKFRSLGIQGDLLRIRLAATILFYCHQSTVIYTGVKPTNHKSLRNIVRAGFTPLRNTPPELLDACATCRTSPDILTGRLCCCDFFQIHIDGICRAITDLLTFYPLRKSTNIDNQMSVNLSLTEAFQEASQYRSDEDTNNSNYWDALREFTQDSCS